jgi:putative ABC transport system permease protein
MNDDQIGTLRQELSSIPSAFLLETKLLNDLVNKLVNQFTSFPILVAALSLAVGGIVIANSVALTTLERKREIAVMKAVGLQRERVLGMLLLENGLMGFIGGLIGVGIGMVVLLAILATLFGGVITAPIPYSTALLLMALCIGISIIAAMLTAWGASGEKPLNVLRYE